jgi:PKD repeat protein
MFVMLLTLAFGLLIAQPVIADDTGAKLSPGVTTTFTISSISASASPSEGQIPLSVQFTDTSRKTLYYWYWDFGDGSQVSGYQTYVKNPLHTYMKTGVFDITLATKDQYGRKTIPVDVATITVTSPTINEVNFSGAPIIGCAPLLVCFSDTSTGSPNSWLWDFGDGSNSTEKNPCHPYTSPGIYSVSLTIVNQSGNSTKTISDYITVSGVPIAGMEVNVTNCSPFVIQCRDISTGSPITWLWDFGDGTQSTIQNPIHTYNSVPNGAVTINLTVGNRCGTSSTSKSISPDCEIVKFPAKIKVASTDGEFPISGAGVYIAPYVMHCAPSPMVGCSFYPDESNLTYLGITDDNGILSTFVPKGYLEIIANRSFSDENIACPNAGVTWTGKETKIFTNSPDVIVNLTDKKYNLCML